MTEIACICSPGDLCLGVPGESDDCKPCLVLDPEEGCLAGPVDPGGPMGINWKCDGCGNEAETDLDSIPDGWAYEEDGYDITLCSKCRTVPSLPPGATGD